METFGREEDYVTYLELKRTWCDRHKVEVQAYCLMPNHVHLIAVPETADGLARSIGEAHRRYARHINFREGWRGYLWQGRFASFVMDEQHFLAALRYVELNPVRAGLAGTPAEWPWSSVRAHLTGQADPLLGDVGPMRDYIGDWESYLALDIDEEERLRFQQHTRTGRPLGGAESLEQNLGRTLRKLKPCPKTAKDEKRKVLCPEAPVKAGRK
jgi:putative transposase